MALDASKGNRAKETYDIKVDYGTICGSNDTTEIRKMVALEIIILEKLMNKSTKQINDMIDGMQELLKMNDKTLHKHRVKMSEELKRIVKPRYELLHYHFADDNSIIINYRNNIKNKTANMIVRKGKHEIKDLINELIDKLTELQNKNKLDKQGIKMKYDLLVQVIEKEKEII